MVLNDLYRAQWEAMLDRIRQSKLRPAVCSLNCIVFLLEVQHWQLQYMLPSSVFKVCYRPGLHLHYGSACKCMIMCCYRPLLILVLLLSTLPILPSQLSAKVVMQIYRKSVKTVMPSLT